MLCVNIVNAIFVYFNGLVCFSKLFHFLLTKRDHKQEVYSEKYPFSHLTPLPRFNIESLERNALDLRVCKELSQSLISNCTVINRKRQHFEGVNICVFKQKEVGLYNLGQLIFI